MIIMLNAQDALAFIETAREQQKPVFGIDSFLVTATTTKPMMDHILDLSVGGLPADSWTEAQRFVEERREMGLTFEIVV